MALCQSEVQSSVVPRSRLGVNMERPSAPGLSESIPNRLCIELHIRNHFISSKIQSVGHTLRICSDSDRGHHPGRGAVDQLPFLQGLSIMERISYTIPGIRLSTALEAGPLDLNLDLT